MVIDERQECWYRQLSQVISEHQIEGIVLRFLQNVEIVTGGCWLWKSGVSELGYGLCTKGLYGTPKAHRAAYMIFNGEIPKGLHVCHSCDVRNCVNPDHLWVGTHQDNMRDRQEKGRWQPPQLRGEENPMSRLSDEEVREIRLLCVGGMTQRKIAEKYSVSQMTVSRISRRELWSHVI